MGLSLSFYSDLFLVLFVPFFGYEAQFVVPLFAVFSGERLFQKLVDFHAVGFAERFCALAHIPLVVVHGLEGGELVDADGVEVARDGLVEVCLAFAVGLFDGAFAHTVVKVGEHALFLAYDGSHQVAVFVGVAYALPFYHFFRLCGQVVPYHGQYGFYFFCLLGLERSAGVAVHAALPLALRYVAQKLFLDNVEAHYGVVNLYHFFS